MSISKLILISMRSNFRKNKPEPLRSLRLESSGARWRGSHRQQSPMRAKLMTGAMLIAISALIQPAAAARDWQAVARTLGKPGKEMPDGVYRVGLPRSDLKVSLDGIEIKPDWRPRSRRWRTRGRSRSTRNTRRQRGTGSNSTGSWSGWRKATSLIVTKMDRLARNVKQLLTLVEELEHPTRRLAYTRLQRRHYRHQDPYWQAHAPDVWCFRGVRAIHDVGEAAGRYRGRQGRREVQGQEADRGEPE